jgi:pimeloyl-ACP methyl ester carboxylesterase
MSVVDYISQNYDLRPELRKISIPVTIMMGAKSELFPNAGVMYLDEQIPRSNLVRFERSGHALFLTEPNKFRKALRQFLEL